MLECHKMFATPAVASKTHIFAIETFNYTIKEVKYMKYDYEISKITQEYLKRDNSWKNRTVRKGAAIIELVLSNMKIINRTYFVNKEAPELGADEHEPPSYETKKKFNDSLKNPFHIQGTRQSKLVTNSIDLWITLYDKNFLEGTRSLVEVVGAIVYLQLKTLNLIINLSKIVEILNNVDKERQVTEADILRVASDIQKVTGLVTKEENPIYILQTLWPKFGMTPTNVDIFNNSKTMLAHTHLPEGYDMTVWIASILYLNCINNKPYPLKITQEHVGSIVGVDRRTIFNYLQELEKQLGE